MLRIVLDIHFRNVRIYTYKDDKDTSLKSNLE